MTAASSWGLTARLAGLRLRGSLVRSVRRFFGEEGFLEVETPLLIPAPAPEEYIEAIAAGEWFLQTSPELCMKRLLAAGYGKIYQICKAFRKGERGDLHLPEFTILEWYRAHADYLVLMDDCERLISEIGRELEVSTLPLRQGRGVAIEPPWERMTVEEAFRRYAEMSPSEAVEKGCFEEVLTRAVEPHLGVERPLFLYDYPRRQASLARLKAGFPEVAERFELYIAGIEIANGFSELTDAGEQRLRFEEAARERSRNGMASYPVAERFLEALPDLPPSAGIALGLDRLVMLFAGRTRIDDAVAFTPEML